MMARAVFIAIIMAATAAGAGFIRPSAPPPAISPDLTALTPDRVGEWRALALSGAILPAEIDLEPGEAVQYRSYADAAGRILTLVVAYGPPLGDSVRLHRPESCYVAQGFRINSRQTQALAIGDRNVRMVTMQTQKSLRREAVSYWLRDGDDYVTSAPARQLLAFKRSSTGRADGALVRVSSNGADDRAFERHQDFLTALQAATSEEAQTLIFAAAP